MLKKEIKILFIGDVFGKPGILEVSKQLKNLKAKYPYDFVIIQAENVSGRKGLNKTDYETLKKAGVNVFTLGNHVWSKEDIKLIINNEDVIRPANIDKSYAGEGSRLFDINGVKLRVTSLMGIVFNRLLPPWGEEYANSFFDTMDQILMNDDSDFHIIDFHAETTSEKNVLGIYLDGKVSAVLGTHTHVQTNDARILEKGTAFITDVGMTGPSNSAIGANYEEVYQKMRYNTPIRFKVSDNKAQFNAVFLKLRKNKKHKIQPINILD
ncbi:TIGR00282 family metallophosphoesterase [Mycoplasma iguanae]|uniref:TIGR00282 family metallophosphoesterase n=1 Tax=Mycoplasma iguanae TaxID=292461 RepID=A0ABY5RB50_9MOLU|nr:TIGR00282 family metallophosphoesterase [Mycoplasma iguanae]UVD81999.1 TIGR00282 family metallophosphoesterase [Mycoplasma iguanae]